jgi:hypothetical protein
VRSRPANTPTSIVSVARITAERLVRFIFQSPLVLGPAPSYELRIARASFLRQH